MRTLEKVFQNEDLVVKSLKGLNYSWKPKVIVLYESRNLSPMDLATLVSKLQEHDVEPKKVAGDEEGDKKKTLALKVEEMTPLVRKWR